jgi:predicted small lipoprotein YifL
VSLRLKIIACLVAALALSGCGRRGPLEPPPGSPAEPRASQQIAPQPRQGAPAGLFRNTSSKPDEPETRTETPPKRPSPFVLDPLL